MKSDNISHWVCNKRLKNKKVKCCNCFPHKTCTQIAFERTSGVLFCGTPPVYDGSIKGINKIISDHISVLLNKINKK